MTHRYSNLAEAQRAEAIGTIMATGHFVDMEAGNLARLTEILEDHHASVQLCEEYGLSTESVDAAAARLQIACGPRCDPWREDRR